MAAFNFDSPQEDLGNFDLEDISIESYEQKYSYIKATKAREWIGKIAGKEGELELGAGFIDVILVMTPVKNNREYYDKPYVEGQVSRAACYSADGLKPSSRVFHPQSTNCQNCTQAQNGSYNKDGKVGVACRQKRRFVLTFPGKERFFCFTLNPASQKAFRDYFTLLKSKNTQMYKIVTRLSFTKKINFPKVEFAPVGYVAKEDFVRIAEFLKDKPLWTDMLGLTPELAAPATQERLPEPEMGEDTSFNFAKEPDYSEEKPKGKVSESAIDKAMSASIPDDF